MKLILNKYLVMVIVLLSVIASGICMDKLKHPIDSSFRPRDEILSVVKNKWDIFCMQYPSGTHISVIEKGLEGSYRDRGTCSWGGTGRRTIYFLIDDFFQLCVDVDNYDKTMGKCVVSKRQLWARFPDGEVMLIENNVSFPSGN